MLKASEFFVAGDQVRCVNNDGWPSSTLEEGKHYIVQGFDIDNDFMSVEGVYAPGTTSTLWLLPLRFELAATGERIDNVEM